MAGQAQKLSIGRSFLTGALSLFVALLVQAGTVSAADTACDPQFMDAIEARGFVEGARENAQNQNLIFKPDSVLEYSCFLDHAPIPSATATLLFKDSSLKATTTSPAAQYISQSFGHDFLNGRYKQPAVSSSGFCAIQKSVFIAAKCLNFYDRIDLDTMYDLTWYTRNDPRQLPNPCSAPPYNGLNMAVDIAYNNRTAAWTMGPYLRDAVNYIADPFKIMDNMFKPGACGTAIPTGMVVTDYNAPVDSFLEKTCSNPACVYIPKDYGSGECSMPQ